MLLILNKCKLSYLSVIDASTLREIGGSGELKDILHVCWVIMWNKGWWVESHLFTSQAQLLMYFRAVHDYHCPFNIKYWPFASSTPTKWIQCAPIIVTCHESVHFLLSWVGVWCFWSESVPNSNYTHFLFNLHCQQLKSDFIIDGLVDLGEYFKTIIKINLKDLSLWDYS